MKAETKLRNLLVSALERELEQLVLENIQEQVLRYLRGDLALAEFEDWFSGVFGRLDEVEDPAAENLSYDIQQRLGERSHGGWSEDDLRRRFATGSLFFGITPSFTTSSMTGRTATPFSGRCGIRRPSCGGCVRNSA